MGLTGLAFLVGFLGLLVMSVVRSPMYGVYAYVAAFYANPPSRWWSAALPDLRWALLAAAVLMISIIAKQPRGYRTDFFSRAPVIIVIVFIAWVWLQVAWAVNTKMQIDLAVMFTKYLIVLYMLYEVLRTEEDLKKFMIANVLGASYLAFIIWSRSGGAGRLDGVGGPGLDDANALGMQLAVAIVFASVLLLVLRDRWWFAVLLVTPLLVNGVVQTVSRSAFLALVMGGAAIWYLRPRGYSRLFYTYAAAALIGFSSIAGYKYWDRMNTIKEAAGGNVEVERSAQSRIVIILAQWEIFKDNPLGVGHRGTATLSPFYIEESFLGTGRSGGQRSSHSTFFSLLAEQSLPGVIIFFIAVGWGIVTLRRLKTLDGLGAPPLLGAARAAAGGGLIVVLVAGLFVDFLKTEVQFWCLAMVMCLQRIAERDYSNGVIAPAAGATRRRRRIIGQHAQEGEPDDRIHGGLRG